MLKKSLSLFLTLVIILSALLVCPVMAEQNDITGANEADGPAEAGEGGASGSGAGFDLSQLHCRYALLVDAADPTVALYGIEKNADEQCATGSTIKILTCMIAIEQGDLDEYVTISAEAVNFSNKNSLMGLREGERWTLRDLLYGLMLPSGNDAAVAVAECIAGSTKEFAKLMNTKGKEIGMTNSHFVTVNGRDDKRHYSTVRDMALLTAYALKNEEFCKIVGTGQYTCSDESGTHTIELINTDRLIVDQVAADGTYTPKSCLYKYGIGVKTGDTNNAGKCFIGAARKGGTTLIAVLLGGTLDDEYYQKNWLNMHDKQKDPYNAQRFEDAILCFNYAFKQMSVLLTVQDLVDAGMPVEFNDIQVENYDPADETGGLITVRVDIDTTQELQIMKPYYDEIMGRLPTAYTLHLSTPLYAPVTEGDTVGTITYDIGIDALAPSYNLIAERSVAEGIIATAPIESSEPGEVGSLIGVATDKTGAEVKPDVPKAEKTAGEVVLIVVICVLAVGVLAFLIVLIVAKIRREKRRKARLARKKRQRELMRRKAQGHYDRYE